MHVISRKALRKFGMKHRDSQGSLNHWFKAITKHDFHTFNELRTTFPTADKVGDFIVFNISSNKYRLIASVHFNRGKVYVRHVLTHPEYEKGAWNNERHNSETATSLESVTPLVCDSHGKRL